MATSAWFCFSHGDPDPLMITCVGSNDLGQLGSGEDQDATGPVRMDGF